MQSFYGAGAAAKFRPPLEEFEGPRNVQATDNHTPPAGGIRSYPPLAAQSFSQATSAVPGQPAAAAAAAADEWSQPAPTLQDVAEAPAAKSTSWSHDAGAAEGVGGGWNGKGPGSPNLRTMSFREWLLWLEPSASLLGYQEALEENYDSVAQIVKTYMVPAKGGRRVLDTQFFDDIRATSEEDQATFLRWFMRESGASGVPHSPLPASQVHLAPAELGPKAVSSAGGQASQRQQQPHPERQQAPAADLDLRTCSFRDWLERAAPAGELLEYLEALEDSFDTVAQITRTYVADGGGGAKELAGQFFEDIGVSSQSHQRLFRDWFEVACGVQRGPGQGQGGSELQRFGSSGSPGAAGGGALSAGGGGGPRALEAWLQTHGLEEYVPHLHSAGYDDLSLLADLQGGELAEMLDAIGLSQPGLRAVSRKPVRRKNADLYIEDETDEFTAAVQRGDTPTVASMLQETDEDGAATWALGPLDDDDSTALHLASAAPTEGQLRLVRMLCLQRADPNRPAKGGVTPLHMAVQRSSKYVVRMLLCNGGDNQRRTEAGQSTVDLAQCNPSPIEMYEVVGWPGEGPRLKPLEPRRPAKTGEAAQAGNAVGSAGAEGAAVGAAIKGAGAALATGAGDREVTADVAAAAAKASYEGLSWPLLLAALWFALLAAGAAFLIRNV